MTCAFAARSKLARYATTLGLGHGREAREVDAVRNHFDSTRSEAVQIDHSGARMWPQRNDRCSTVQRTTDSSRACATRNPVVWISDAPIDVGGATESSHNKGSQERAGTVRYHDFGAARELRQLQQRARVEATFANPVHGEVTAAVECGDAARPTAALEKNVQLGSVNLHAPAIRRCHDVEHAHCRGRPLGGHRHNVRSRTEPTSRPVRCPAVTNHDRRALGWKSRGAWTTSEP